MRINPPVHADAGKPAKIRISAGLTLLMESAQPIFIEWLRDHLEGHLAKVALSTGLVLSTAGVPNKGKLTTICMETDSVTRATYIRLSGEVGSND